MECTARMMLSVLAASLMGWSDAALAAAAQSAATGQELVKAKESGRVIDARWERRGDSYQLLLALDLVNSAGRRYPPDTPRQQAAREEAAASMRQRQAELQQRLAALPPTEDRASFFIGNTIANLRGLDPSFHCGRGLSLVDGRRAPAGPSPGLGTDFRNQAFPPQFKEPRVDAWLLKADGTQAMPAIYNCIGSPVRDATPARRVDISYEFTAAEGAEAWAVAIRIDDDFYIEKLEPQPAPE